MGFALPGAIAANLVFSDRRILDIAGDGSFMMNVQEMETGRRLDSDIVMILWEDGGYGLIAWKQENELDRYTHRALGNPNWLELASAFGWHGHYVNRSMDLQDVLETAFTESGPSLVVVLIDYRENRILTERLGEITQPM